MKLNYYCSEIKSYCDKYFRGRRYKNGIYLSQYYLDDLSLVCGCEMHGKFISKGIYWEVDQLSHQPNAES